VEIRELRIPHVYEVTPRIHADERGHFLESYRADLLEAATHRQFDLQQTNLSVSRRGVVRGVHFAEVRPSQNSEVEASTSALHGQAKFVTVVSGSVTDFVIDIRAGSPTFGEWVSVELDDSNHKAVFMSEGLGHLFVVTSPTATVSYMINNRYDPPHEHGINPLDPKLALEFPIPISELMFSPQDSAAVSLDSMASTGLLPDWDVCLETYATVGVSR
jgi:dTDP-4-dehydrorhamnose 3,5-epimerase